MVQTVYTSARDVDVRKCEPQTLLRSNYLSEFRTEAEKLKVCRNLGITAGEDFIWKNLKGEVSDSESLVKYIADEFKYTNPKYPTISNVKNALDYILTQINDYPQFKVSIKALEAKNDILEAKISDNTDLITTVNDRINDLSENLSKLDEVKAYVDDKVEFINSIIGDDGVMFTPDESLANNLTTTVTLGGIIEGTTLQSLKEKSISQILVDLLFPVTIIGTLEWPYCYIDSPEFVKVGDNIVQPSTQFFKGSSGGELSNQTTISFENSEYKESTYNYIGEYTYKYTVNYAEGDPLKDSLGNETDQFIPSGSVSAVSNTYATIPFFIDGKEYLQKFGQEITIQFSSINPVIKVPENATYKVLADLGLGFMEVNGWTITPEDGYVVYSKPTSYADVTPHKLIITLNK